MKMIVKKYYKDFVLRGLCAMGFGPMVLSVIYWILGLCGTLELLSWSEVVLGIITISILAFLAAGITVVYQIEELPLTYAIALHGSILYLLYLSIYLLNGWLKSGWIPFVVFSIIFILGYFIIWGIIYFVIKKNTEKLNKRLNADR